ncbi:unnamed protein product, partial [marine sediment metagenome]
MVCFISWGKHFRLIYEIYAKGLKHLSLHEVTYAALSHYR